MGIILVLGGFTKNSSHSNPQTSINPSSSCTSCLQFQRSSSLFPVSSLKWVILLPRSEATQNPDQSPSPNLCSAYIYKGCRVFLPGRQRLQLFLLCRHPVPLHALHLSFLPLAKKCIHAALQDAQIPLHNTQPHIYTMQGLHCFWFFILLFLPGPILYQFVSNALKS